MAKAGKMPRGVTQIGPESFRWRLTRNGKAYQGVERTVAAAMRARTEAEIEAGGTPKEFTSPTVRDLVAMHMGKAKHHATTSERLAVAQAAIPDSFMDRQAADIRPVLVEALYQSMAANGTGAHTIVKASHILSKAFQLGLVLELVTSNPFRIIKPDKPPPAKRIDPPTPAQVRAIIAHVAPEYRPWLQLMAVMGARPGEMCGLQWGDIDFDRGTIHISRSVDKAGNVTDGKNGTSGWRTVGNVHLPTMTALRRVERVVGCSWVWTADGIEPWRPQRVGQVWRRATRELGVDQTLYSLRHFAATQAFAAEIQPAEVANMLGDSLATVMKTYVHYIKTHQAASAAIGAALEG